MTCPACNATLAPGAYCDGNGSHPPRRARRLTGDERRAAQREAETRREAERTHAALVAVARPVVESAQQRRYLYRCGDLAGELAEAVKVGLITWEEAARLEAETAAKVAAVDAERARKRAEYEKTREIPAGFVAPFRYDGHGYIWDANNEMAADNRGAVHSRWRPRGWGRISYLPDAESVMNAWTAWVADAVGEGEPDGEEVARRMNVRAGVYPDVIDDHGSKRFAFGYLATPEPEPRRRTSHTRALGVVALAGALMGVGGLGDDR
jgi:hypothetical protein